MDTTPLKKENKKGKRKYLIVIAVFEVLIIVGLLLWVFLAKPSNQDIEIKTPYATMRFPGKWKDHLYTERKEADGCTVSFYAVIPEAPNYHLFDICFGGEEGERLGDLVTGQGEKISVWILPGEGADSTYSEDEYQIIYAMLDDANYLIEKLDLHPAADDSASVQNPGETTGEIAVYEDMVIQTPYCDLIYPGRWREQLRVEHTETSGMYTVSFYAVIVDKPEQHLFDISLGKRVTDCFAVIRGADGKEVEMMMNSGSFEPNDAWNQEQLNSVYAMMDDVNIILENLDILRYPGDTLDTEETLPQVTEPETTQPSNTQPGTIEPQDTTPETVPETEPVLVPPVGDPELSGEMVIDTPYGQLKYPEKWVDYLEVVHIDQNPYVVEFYCVLPQRDSELLFAIYIGGSSGDQIGTLLGSNGQTYRVGVVSRELAPPADWSQAETEVFYLMLEDINYIIESLA